MSKITITIVVEDGNISVSQEEQKVKDSEELEPFILDPDDENHERPHNILDDTDKLIQAQANKFADQFMDKMSHDKVVGEAVRTSLVSDETLDTIDKMAKEDSANDSES